MEQIPKVFVSKKLTERVPAAMQVSELSMAYSSRHNHLPPDHNPDLGLLSSHHPDLAWLNGPAQSPYPSSEKTSLLGWIGRTLCVKANALSLSGYRKARTCKPQGAEVLLLDRLK